MKAASHPVWQSRRDDVISTDSYASHHFSDALAGPIAKRSAISRVGFQITAAIRGEEWRIF